MKIAFLLSTALLIAGCSDDFSPNGKYQKRLIIYAALDGSDTVRQMIRVYSTYSPDEYNPLTPSPNKEIVNAEVKIFDGTRSYTFHDTLVTVQNGAAGTRQVRAFVNYALRPTEGKTYSLTAYSPGYDTAKSTITGVLPGDIIAGNSGLFAKPETEKYIPIKVALGSNARAYLVTISLEYEVPGDSVLKIKESPVLVRKDETGAVIQRIYPGITFRDPALLGSSAYETIAFESAAYSSAIADIRKENSGIKFRRAILTLKQFDNALSTYYSITNAFGGGSTIRLDEPDYTNIGNGFGVFGMMTKQENSYVGPAN